MTAFRFIPLSLHAAVEAVAAPLIMAAPFLLGFEPAAAIATVAFGALLLGLTMWTQSEENGLPLTTHAAMDYGFAFGMILAGLLLGLAKGDLAATLFLVGAGAAHTALTASTRFSLPRGAH